MEFTGQQEAYLAGYNKALDNAASVLENSYRGGKQMLTLDLVLQVLKEQKTK